MEQRDRHLREERIRNHRRQLIEEQELLTRARKANYFSHYELPLTYPARIVAFDDENDGDGTDAKKPTQKTLRTSSDFVNARLLEAALPLGCGRRRNCDNTTSSLSSHAESMNRFVRDLEGTGCYDTVRVGIGMPSTTSSSEEGKCDVTVKLNEKKWYKLHIGGGVNADDLTSIGGGGGGGGSGGGGPKMQFETSASLLNLTGYADISSASYNVDQMGSANFGFAHDRPLVSCLSRNSKLYRWLMPKVPGMTNSNNDDDDDDDADIRPSSPSSSLFRGGRSHTSLGLHASCDDEDYERTRSSREYVRSIGLRLANHNIGTSGSYRPSTSSPESMAGPYLFAEWNASLRDAMPCRCPTHPYKLDCSQEVAQSAGTTLKHSVSAGLYLNGKCTDDRQDPTEGYDAHVMGEVAGPPGDVGYWKLKGGWTYHLPVRTVLSSIMAKVDHENDSNLDLDGINDQDDEGSSTSFSVTGMTLHSSLNCGIIRPLGGLFGGAIGSTLSLPLIDRFYVGGPGTLRGFLPSGIGPRSIDAGGSSVPGGDSLGGDLFYTSTLAISAPFPTYFAALRGNGARLFGFANAGTCVISSASPLIGMDSPETWRKILSSTRLAVGGGVSAGSPMGRFEATYAVPVRYGPRDARRSVQFGLSAQFGG